MRARRIARVNSDLDPSSHALLRQTHGLVEQLIRGVCFPAIGAQAVRDQRLQALMAAETARLRAAGGGASTAQQQQQQQMQALGELLGRVTTAGPSSVAYPELEKCVAAARAHQVTGADRSSREAAFDLLLDLVAHDSGCWQQVHGGACLLLGWAGLGGCRARG